MSTAEQVFGFPEVDISWYKNDCVGEDENGMYYWYDEAYIVNGPYQTEHEARIDLAVYCHYELDGYSTGVRP